MALNLARIQELHPDLASKWTLASADAAISAHENGDFQQSARLVDAMGRDDRIDAVLGTRIQAVLGLDFELEPADPAEADGRSNKSVAKQFIKQWYRLCTEERLGEALKWRRMMGFGIGELIWYDDRGKLQSSPQRLKLWHPQHSRFDHDRQKFMIRQAGGPEIEVTHGDGKWVVFGNGLRPWMRGAVRALWILWLARQYAYRDWNLFSERTGQGILGVKTIDSGVAGEERNRIVYDLQQRWRGIIAELPQRGDQEGSAGLELLETDGGTVVFDQLISRTDTAIAVLMLGQNLTTEVKGGSFAAASAHDRIRIDYLRADVDQLATDCQTGILEPWAERSNGSRDLAPYPKWDADPPEDEKAAAEGQKAFGEAVTAIQAAGYDVKNIDELGEKYGFKLEKKPEPPPGTMAPGVPGVAGVPAPGNPKPWGPAAGNPTPAAAPKAAAKPPAVPLRAVAASMLSQADDDPGFTQGQDYVDRLVAAGTQRASEALATDIANILRIVQAADSPEALRAGLAALYADSTPTELSNVLERARLMAELAGKYSVIETVIDQGVS